MTDFDQELLEFHGEYNLILDEQDKLPSKKGNKDYSAVESVIISMAQNLIRKLLILYVYYTRVLLKGQTI